MCDINNIMTLPVKTTVKTIMSVVIYLGIITRMKALTIGLASILQAIMSVSTFITAVILFLFLDSNLQIASVDKVQ